MRVLYLTNKPIFPLIDGGCVAMHEFLKCLLNAGYNVKNLSISTPKHPFEKDKYPTKLSSIIQPEDFFINTKISAINAAKSLFINSSYNIDRFYSVEFEKIIIDYINKNECEIVIFESIYFAHYVERIKKKCKVKTLLRSHNVEHEIWEKLASNESNPLKKIYLNKLAKNLKKVELSTLPRFDGILCISKSDKNKFKTYLPNINYATIPITIEQSQINSNYSIQRFFHIGSMNWKPNIESVNLLINEIFPKIRTLLPDAELILAGSNMPKEIESNTVKGIIVLGYIEDLSSFMASNGIMIVPLKSGSGVRVKLLEGLSIGVPIVTTSQGAEGIESTLSDSTKQTMIIEDEIENIIAAAVNLFQNQELRSELAENGKKLIQSKYQIEPVTNKIIEFIKHIS
jgi:glycosyltransferase involved in cell wall biosynthesis